MAVTVMGQGFAGAGAIGREAPDFVFTGGVDYRIHPLVVMAEYRTAGARALRHGDFYAPLRAGTGNADLAAGGDDDAFILIG